MVCGNDEDDLQEPRSSSQAGCTNQDGCSNNDCQRNQQPQGSFGSWVRRQQAPTDGSPAVPVSEPELGTCRKCKQRPAVLHIRQQEPYCNECLEAGVQQKVRTATKTQGLVQTGDHVMVAVSGGAASLALLSCIVEMKSTNPSRPERGKVPFQLTVVHVDTSAATGIPPEQAAKQVQELQESVAAAGYQGTLLTLQLASVFAGQQQLQPQIMQEVQRQMEALHVSAVADQQQQQQLSEGLAQASVHSAAEVGASSVRQHEQQLVELVQSISDTTGREDLNTCLQDQLLLHAAVALGCNRLLLGECASRVAVKIIAEAAKGRGYSLPADIQLLDARSLPGGGPVVVHPLREVTYKELVAVCAYKGITWSDRVLGQPMLQQQHGRAAAAGSSRGSGKAGAAAVSINSLAEKFIDDMQSSVPASIYTILRTAAHLEPFGFNEIVAVPEAANASLPPTARAERARHLAQLQASNCSSGGAEGMKSSPAPLQLCSLCRAPLPAADTDRIGNDAAEAAEARLSLAGLTGRHSKQLCYSCNRQILFQVVPGAAAHEVSGRSSEVHGTLESRMQRLKQLLPPGMLLEED